MVKKVLIGLVLLFLFSSFIKNYSEFKKNTTFFNTFKNDYEREKDRNNKLKMEALKQSDPSEIEKTIRNKLNMVKDKEIAIIVPTPTLEPVVVAPTPLPVYK